jgi:hypothetical protein
LPKKQAGVKRLKSLARKASLPQHLAAAVNAVYRERISLF